MNNFEYCCPTHVVFGKGSISKLRELIPQDKKVLMIYGGGSIKKNGVYNQVKAALEGYNLLEFGGIEPNPKYETCMKAVEIVKKEGVDLLLSVGGGSTLDGTKFISLAACYDGDDAYDAIMIRGEHPAGAIPIGDVITLPATGSEMNDGAVVSRLATDEKLAFHDSRVYPRFSIIDPEVTFSLPVKQTINGIVDTFVHTMEQYCTYDVNSPLQDDWALGILRTLIKEAPKVLANPTDYDARANIFWCATCGLNYWISLGVVQDWATHLIGHELTAFYGVDHGQSLAIVEPRLLKNQKVAKAQKLAKLAREVFCVDESVDLKAADIAIEKIEEFYNSIGMKTRLADYGINAEEAASRIRDRFRDRGTKIGEKMQIDADVTYDILINC